MPLVAARYIGDGMATIIFALLWQLQVPDPSPLDPHLHGPHTHGAGSYPPLWRSV
jgi:hypothetical protein